MASGYCPRRAPKITRVAIIAMFQKTGATYDKKNLWWLFRIPRHQADSTRSPTPGNRMRTTRTVSSRTSPWKPGATKPMTTGVARTPTATITLTERARRVATTPATRPASSSSFSARRRA